MSGDGVRYINREESVPPLPNPEQPPLAPYDPPDPAPQAAAWARALRVIFTERPRTFGGEEVVVPMRGGRTNKRGRAAIKGRRSPRGPTH